MTGQDICRQAMMDALLLGAGRPIDPGQAADVLNKLNRIIDNWNADGRMVYAEVSASFTLTANLNPQTIGPTGATFTVTQRPVSIESANIEDTAVTPTVNIKLRIIDYRAYANQSVPAVTAPIPTQLYYEPDWPNGKIYLWPVPTQAYGLQLWYRTVLAQLALTSTFSLPPGYWDALTLTLAEDICPMYEQPVPPIVAMKAAQARARIAGNNTLIPHIRTNDAGMPNGGNLSTWNYLTGDYSGGPRW